jgi:hypothetical protein
MYARWLANILTGNTKICHQHTIQDQCKMFRHVFSSFKYRLILESYAPQATAENEKTVCYNKHANEKHKATAN